MEENELSIWEHLNDLKVVLFNSFVLWFVATAGMGFFYKSLINFITEPLAQKSLVLNFVSPTDSFVWVFKICSLAGFLLAFPFITYYWWHFLKPGLKNAEQSYVSKYVFASLILSTIGVVFTYIYIVPTTLQYLLEFIPENTQLLLTANEYMNFLFGLLFIMVLAFQVPVIVFGLIKSNIVPASFFRKRRREVYFAILIFMAVFGASDVISLVLTTVPIILLYEAAIFLAGDKGAKAV
jgi:sec-independent protein translocase protein TatC